MYRKMLSMNMSTSAPSVSRKYSAMVRPVSATWGRGPVDGPDLRAHGRGLVVDRLADHVEQPAQRLDADRHPDRAARRLDRVAAAEAVRRVHGDAADRAVADLLLHLEHDRAAVAGL